MPIWWCSITNLWKSDHFFFRRHITYSGFDSLNDNVCQWVPCICCYSWQWRVQSSLASLLSRNNSWWNVCRNSGRSSLLTATYTHWTGPGILCTEWRYKHVKVNIKYTSGITWGCVGMVPMTAVPWRPPTPAYLCLRPRLLSRLPSRLKLRTSAAYRLLSGGYTGNLSNSQM